ncbi:MAG: T9SS type A sorting domain-containing protein [Bacteroidetes bacterium]|nr:T9SS type A sorting domain-containing protein [Bacteroidota bacterium]
MKNNKFNIKEYSALSLSFIAVSASLQGQVIYTDIEPDAVLEYSGGVIGIDMDNDGTYDFAFKNTVFSNYSTLYHTSFRYERILAGPVYTPLNLIAGSRKTYGGSYAGSFYVYFPYALEEGALITPPALHFQNYGFQRMAFADYYYSPWLGWTTWDGGLWFPEKIEHFIGVRFIDDDSLYHHGWIRCSVIDTGHTLIIHDYAYESQPNHPIAAGSLETYVDIENNNPLYSIYSFGNTIYYHLPSEDLGSEITLFDLAGRIIYSGIISETYSSISPNCLPGIYVVRITTSTQSITRKVSIGN